MPPEPSATPPSSLTILTPREEEVARMLAHGATCREIAKALGTSIKTIDSHRQHILKKLGCKNNVALTRLMIREGHVRP